MSIADTTLKQAKSKDRDYKLTDEKGMHILVTKSGYKYFRLSYRFAGKQKTLALGVYPETTLKTAREKRDEARKLLSEGIDPSEVRKTKKYNIYNDAINNFEAIAREWHDTNKSRWVEDHAKAKLSRLEKHIFPYLGSRPIKNITTQELLSVLRLIEGRGTIEMAHRAKNIVSEIFDFAVSTVRADRNITLDLRNALKPMPAKKHRATITDTNEIGGLLRAIDSYKGEIVTKCALQLTPYVFVRPGELQKAEWVEIDFEKKVWKIPAGK